MKRTSKCPKCDSSDIIADAKAIDRGHLNAEADLSLATFQRPKALLSKGKLTTTISAWVCAACGYIEFYADSPQTIKGGSTLPPPEPWR
jgi:predicted nucleic-acid-binding Zn-ribbon protein